MPPRHHAAIAPRPSASARRDRALAACVAGARALQRGQRDAALERFAHAVDIAPDDPEIAVLRGIALRDAAKLADAQRELIRAVHLDPSRADSFVQLAQTYRIAGDRTQAARAFQCAATLQPRNATAWRDAAESLRVAGQLHEALDAANHAAQLSPADSSIANTTALILHRQGRIDEALALCAQSRSHSTHDANLALTHGMLLRTMDCYDVGWPLNEHRLGLPQLLQRANPPASPRWSGDSLAGRHILVRAEQGLGDQVQFIRWATLLRAAGASSVTVHAAPSLVRLLETAPQIDAVVSTDAPAPEHDVHVDIMSLPHLLRTGADMHGDLVPYLSPPGSPPGVVCQLSRDPSTLLRLGVVWAGTPQHADDWTRSMSLGALLPAISHPSVQIVVLQQGAPRADLDTIDPVVRNGFVDAAAVCHDMGDTAHVMAQCDVILTVDTAVAHVAGALGLPVWIMVAHPAEWRWGRDRAHAPAYPSAHLIRQHRSGAWSDVVDDVRTRIVGWLADRGPTDRSERAR